MDVDCFGNLCAGCRERKETDVMSFLKMMCCVEFSPLERAQLDLVAFTWQMIIKDPVEQI